MVEKKGHTAISLFAGAGGLDIGFERAGFEIVFANELDVDAANTWRANRPNCDAMNQGDIGDYIESLKAYKGTTVVFGGPPCQGFSVAGKMNPSDPRSKLIWSFLDVVESVQPKAFVIENVRALGSLKKWESVRNGIIKRAGELGYSCDFKSTQQASSASPKIGSASSFLAFRAIPQSLINSFRKWKRGKAALRPCVRFCSALGNTALPIILKHAQRILRLRSVRS